MNPAIETRRQLLAFLVFVFCCCAGCFSTGQVRFKEIKARLDAEGLRQWALPLAVSFPFTTNLSMNSDVYALRPPAVKNVPDYGMIGPAIRIVVPEQYADRHVLLRWFDTTGDAFSLLVGESGFRQATNSWCYELAPGIYFVESGHIARAAQSGHPLTKPFTSMGGK